MIHRIGLILLWFCLIPTMAFAHLDDASTWLKNKQGEWSAVALLSANQKVAVTSPNPDGKMTTDWERKLIEESALGRIQTKTLNVVKQSQLSNGKFADTIDGNGVNLVNAHIWGIVSLYTAGETIPQKSSALKWLVDHQHADGGFHYNASSRSSDADMTAMALLAFKALGGEGDHPPIQKAFNYLKKVQLANGAFGSMGIENAESTAVVIQALKAYQLDPRNWNGKNLLTALETFHQKDGGYAHTKRGRVVSSQMATEQAVLALADVQQGKSWILRFRDKNLRISDMKTSHWGYPQVNSLLLDGVMSGFPDGSFRPNETLTRAQFATMLVQYTGGMVQPSGSSSFADVPSSHWAKAYIQYAVSKRWLKGVGNSRFAPDKPITAAEAITVFARVKQVSVTQTTPWYKGYVDSAKQKGWLYTGFQPTLSLKRVQAAWLLDTIRKK